MKDIDYGYVRLCYALECDITDLIEYVPEKKSNQT
jgi:DNA-binding Xre family transcriptional regulator